jgi:hypothetical protein
MESEGSLPCSRESIIGPYPEPDESNPHPPNLRSINVVVEMWVTGASYCSSHLGYQMNNGGQMQKFDVAIVRVVIIWIIFTIQ